VSENPVWIHAASMGEVRVAGQFAQELAERGVAVIASAMTEPGYILSQDVYPAGTPCFRIPFDLPGPLGRTLGHFRPSALVLVETEWWPNLLLECARAGVPIFVINGRISERALRRYRLCRAYWQTLLSRVEFFYMRSQEDADRLRGLGVRPERIKASGSLKAMAPPDLLAPPAIPAALRPAADSPVWIAGCTRPGEEEIVLDAFTSLRDEFPSLSLWLAPRHLDRFDQVAALIAHRGYSPVRWSMAERTAAAASQPPVVLVDQMGSLASLYVHATVTFIGGSLRPFGGHNPLEPALAGAPVIFGPHMEDQRDAAALLVAMDAGTQVTDAVSLADAVAARIRAPWSATTRRQSVQRVLERFSHVRAEVASDICARLGIQSRTGRPSVHAVA
jgi:3-deoxy-D-manno-octulosonic-acid transferase